MNKIHVSIIGSCISRELFNDPRADEIFTIDTYAFKPNPINIFSDEKLNIRLDVINKAPNPEFINRNLDYSLNKTLFETLQKKPSEMAFVDLYALIDPMVRVIYKNASTVIITNDVKNSMTKLARTNDLVNNSEKIEFVEVLIKNLSENEIKKGLLNFCEKLNNLFKKVVIIYPAFSKKYFDKNGRMVDYSPEELKIFEEKKKIIDKCTDFVGEHLNNKIIFKYKENLIARYTEGNDFKLMKPNPVHYLVWQKIKCFSELLKILNINADDFLSENDVQNVMLEKTKNQVVEYHNKFKENLGKKLLININVYTNFLKTLKHHLIIFCVRDEATSKLKFWLNRFELGLNFKIGYRDSYFAIIDIKNNFVTEKASHDKLDFNYKIPDTDKSVYVESHGFDAQSLSTIVFKNLELSKNKRGINFAVIDLNTLEVIDRATCDTHEDEFLLVDSDYFSRFNI